MSCLGYPPFFQPELHPSFESAEELDFYTSKQGGSKLEEAVAELVQWVQKKQVRPPRFNIKDPFVLQEISLLKLAMGNPYAEWEPYLGVLADCLPIVAREGGLNAIGKMSPWAKLFEALAVRLPDAPEIQEAAETLWDYGNVDCRFKAVVMLGYTRLRDASSLLLEIFENEPVLNIRTNAILSITKIGWSNPQILSTLKDYYEQGLFKHVIAANLYRFTGDWTYLDFIANEIEGPHEEKTTRLMDFLEPWPRHKCTNAGCENPVFFKEYWWQAYQISRNPSFYQIYTDYLHCPEDTTLCWPCFQKKIVQ